MIMDAMPLQIKHRLQRVANLAFPLGKYLTSVRECYELYSVLTPSFMSDILTPFFSASVIKLSIRFVEPSL